MSFNPSQREAIRHKDGIVPKAGSTGSIISSGSRCMI